MPTQPPRYRPPGWRERKPWAPQLALHGQRKRGRAGMRDRAQVLLEEPFCRHCLADGREVRSEEVDHIRPLAWGGSDTRANKQALCQPCHAAKSAEERAADRADRG